MSTTTTDTTADKLVEMLKENTGRHFLDSGDHYGRNWQQNQEVDFKQSKTGSLEFRNYKGELGIEATLSVYHFLKDRLEYNQELDQQYRKFVEEESGYLDLASAEKFVKTLDGKGMYGEGEPLTVNTYNGEDLLSQILQYVYWSDNDGNAHIMLQIHGGCDVRGGYTDPVAFDLYDHNETAIFNNTRASIYCDDCGKCWDTANACNWYPDGCCGQWYTELQDYSAADQKPRYPERPNPAQCTLPVDLPKRSDPCSNIVWVDDDHNGHCPYCGGLLHLAPWPAR